MPDRISDILHVGLSLMAIQSGANDPGLLRDDRYRRKQQQDASTVSTTG